MNTNAPFENILGNILHPTDCTEADKTAWLHAVKLAFSAQSELTMLHVGEAAAAADRHSLPSISSVLDKWNAFNGESVEPQDGHGSVHAKEINKTASDPQRHLAWYIKRFPPSLLVLSTHQYKKSGGVFFFSLAERLARQAQVPTLFVPSSVKGFVDDETGSIDMKRVLIVGDRQSDAQRLVCRSFHFLQNLGLGGHPAITFLNLRNQLADADAFESGEANEFEIVNTFKSTAEQVRRAEEDIKPDLIITGMSTRRSLGDIVRGTLTERIVRQSEAPILAIPSDATEATGQVKADNVTALPQVKMSCQEISRAA